ncbi:hypothetical protein L1987_15715 [Smallanthus sonchifolius]|uniref:Uncharacterized protein n=1 Tax=Smallanthus sonchifolius TaxID=185202 RepID=A0ACB9J6V2_9ASTR|nr:hypothetical protein L1987_15715 [Smallanthus sonchifolius]
MSPPHVLIFPLPAQGHINAMLKLTELLLPAGIHITFLISDKDYRSLSGVHSRLNSYPGFRFHVIQGLYEGPMDTAEKLSLMFDCLAEITPPLIRNLILDFPVTCLIADGIWDLINSGELPFSGTNRDEQIVNLKGMEGFLRQRDLPSFCRPIISQIQKHCSNIYTIGPLHAHLKSRPLSKSKSSNSLFKEDKTCIGWLDQQPPKSVLYVSFGSLATLTRDQLIEFWHGLVNSKKPFLWVIREDLVLSKDDENKVPNELEKCTKERRYLVGWALQEDVLAHPAVGAFLTHNGWNSTLESIVAGKLGLDMKGTCDRTIVERIVKEVMDVRKEEYTESANRMAKLAMESVSEGGSSYINLDRLIEDIKEMGVQHKDE